MDIRSSNTLRFPGAAGEGYLEYEHPVGQNKLWIQLVHNLCLCYRNYNFIKSNLLFIKRGKYKIPHWLKIHFKIKPLFVKLSLFLLQLFYEQTMKSMILREFNRKGDTSVLVESCFLHKIPSNDLLDML